MSIMEKTTCKCTEGYSGAKLSPNPHCACCKGAGYYYQRTTIPLPDPKWKPENIGVDYAKGHDPVNHPAHYTQGGIECIDAIRAALTEEEFRGFCKGNLIKYAWRERHKGGDESLRKGEFYSRQLTEPRK